jgi:hypothetical protein
LLRQTCFQLLILYNVLNWLQICKRASHSYKCWVTLRPSR